MKTKLLTIALLSATMNSNVFANEAISANVEEARNLVKMFGGQLKPELQKAMKSGGPVSAVEFCHARAPEIAQTVAEKSGWKVNRVSLKPRGATASPDAWETEVLKRFDAEKTAGVEVKTMEFSEVVHDGAKTTFRYMKPLGTAEVCLVCHGTNLTEPVRQAIAKYYPQDQAMGFNKGDIRGAFSFSKAVN
ncbi:cytochrome c [Thiomicrorhabdus immobilis]|uniref:Cytochrome c n=1 Tax=Thiomicrorhabdus immobilis TaxID=2791037 RepID=A0ABM7MAM1_9GAMM|nr:DUF3365 domain-containing protein [Thiomicrorhabdus immobilis]BCN92390.1 cytochrome c [Thiomicrorhabdus immobilis]